MVLGVTDTSQTGPSYSPLGTPLSSASCVFREKEETYVGVSWKEQETLPPPRWRDSRTHPAASLYPLVDVVGEGFAGHEASRALGGVEVPFLQDDLALADDHQRTAAHLRALKDVVLHSLRRGNEEGRFSMNVHADAGK